jgi:hypothetical protein
MMVSTKKSSNVRITHFPKSIHVKTDAASRRALRTLKGFLKQWGFEIETADEFQYSKVQLFAWLDASKGKDLSIHAVDTIKAWILNSLLPFEFMWVNHHRLYTGGMSMRTTSIAESLHNSMKTSYDSVYSSMTLQKSGETMMNKASRRHKANKKRNAYQMISTKLWTSSETSGYLTNYAEEHGQEQWNLSRKCKVCRDANNLFLVWTPSIQNSNVYHSTVPSFYRVRTVTIVGNKFASCSCGVPIRNKQVIELLICFVPNAFDSELIWFRNDLVSEFDMFLIHPIPKQYCSYFVHFS